MIIYIQLERVVESMKTKVHLQKLYNRESYHGSSTNSDFVTESHTMVVVLTVTL